MRDLASVVGATLLLLVAGSAAGQPRSALEDAAAAGTADGFALRRLGEMYASGEGGKKSRKEAARLWRAAADAGDARAPILLADQLYEEIYGRPDASGVRVRAGRIPRAKAEEAMTWYRLAFERDDRPEVRSRAQVLAVSLGVSLGKIASH